MPYEKPEAIGASSDRCDCSTALCDDAYNNYGETKKDSGNTIFPDSNTRALTREDVAGLNEQQALIARNEIFARQGRPYNGADPSLNLTPAEAERRNFLKDHFASQDWYQPRQDYKDSDLNATEQRNISMINMKEIENGWNGAADRFKGQSYAGDTKGSVLAESSQRLLTEEDVANLTPAQLATARNELYARHGREFTTQAYKDHFGQMEWYQPRSDFKEEDFSPLEYRNVLFIRLHES